MEYYKLLQLEREPFSNSPDPNYFFQSRQHQSCLQKIELAVRLRRGLNVVIGDMGTGKTTLCRELIRRLAQEESFETHLILDPSFASDRELLFAIYEMLHGRRPEGDPPAMALKEEIKQALFAKGVDQQRTVVIIIDEGQKIPSFCVELFRELLNYETNEYKLLQIIIFAQKEFEAVLAAHPNFADRINMLHQLEPLNFADTRRLIRHRLKLSGSSVKPLNVFTLPAQWAIFRSTRGYPRRIIHLCHQSILAMIIQNRSRAGWRLIQSCKHRIPTTRRGAPVLFKTATPAVILAALVLVLAVPFIYILQQNDEQKASRHFKIPSRDQTAPPSGAVARELPTEAVQPLMIDAAADGGKNTAATPSAGNADTASASPAAAENHPTPSATPNAATTATALQTDSVPVAVPTPETSEPLQTRPPAHLGGITVKSGDTLSRLVIQAYGDYRNDYVQAVMAANPQLDNPNNIQRGAILRIPALLFQKKTTPVECHWVVLERHDTLAEALRRSEVIAESIKAPMRTMALWSAEQGMHFDLLLSGCFESRQNAQIQADRLPGGFARQAKVISGWDVGTELYSDPYAGGIRKIQQE